jgi:hypothetical protein
VRTAPLLRSTRRSASSRREPHDLDADGGGGHDWYRELGGATDGSKVYSDADAGL